MTKPFETEINSFTGVILAGGSSRRMGQDKTYLKIGNVTLLDRVRQILLDAGASGIVALGKSGEPDGLADENPHKGPAIAIKDYLAKQIKRSRHIFCAVDMPFITPELIRQLSGTDSWAHFSDTPLPFLAIAGEGEPYDGNRLQGFLKAQKPQQHTPPKGSEELFKNLNHPEDI